MMEELGLGGEGALFVAGEEEEERGIVGEDEGVCW
jgi:hypothetical protein